VTTVVVSDSPPGRGIRLAFAAAGHWHFKIDACYLALAREAECDIVGLHADDESVARARADEAGCPWTTDLADLVGRFRPDLVVAMPRPDRAPAQVAMLLERDVPLFAEKPLGTRAEQVWPLVASAERSWVALAFPNRLLPIWDEVDRLRSEDRLGPLAHFNLRLLKGTPKRYVDFGVPWMLSQRASGGGPVRNFGIHLADLVNWQLERWHVTSRPRVVGACLTRLYGNQIEDYGVATLSADGLAITLEAGYTLASPTAADTELRIAAGGATLVQGRNALEVQLADADPRTIPNDLNQTGYRGLFFDALRRFRRGDPPLASVRDCALANETVDAIYDAAKA
jgi:predicted dehydrogenase